MKFIAAVDKNWAIGNKGRLLIRISEDQRNFRQDHDGACRCSRKEDSGGVSGRKTAQGKGKYNSQQES